MAGVYGTSVIPKPALLAITLLGLTGSPAFARSYHLRDIEVVDPWSRPAPAGATAVGYMVLTNHGKRPVSLLSANTTAARRSVCIRRRWRPVSRLWRPCQRASLSPQAVPFPCRQAGII